MRRPSTYQQLFGWHGAAVRGEKPETFDGEAHCGWYKRRLVKGGPWVPVKIWCERDIDPDTGDLASPEQLVMDVEGIRSPHDPRDAFSWLVPISKAAFDHLSDKRLRDNRYFDSTKPIDLSDAPTPPQGT